MGQYLSVQSPVTQGKNSTASIVSKYTERLHSSNKALEAEISRLKSCLFESEFEVDRLGAHIEASQAKTHDLQKALATAKAKAKKYKQQKYRESLNVKTKALKMVLHMEDTGEPFESVAGMLLDEDDLEVIIKRAEAASPVGGREDSDEDFHPHHRRAFSA